MPRKIDVDFFLSSVLSPSFLPPFLMKMRCKYCASHVSVLLFTNPIVAGQAHVSRLIQNMQISMELVWSLVIESLNRTQQHIFIAQHHAPDSVESRCIRIRRRVLSFILLIIGSTFGVSERISAKGDPHDEPKTFVIAGLHRVLFEL